MKPRAAALVAILTASCAPPPPPPTVVVAPPRPAEPDLRPDRPPTSGPRGETAALKDGAVVIQRPPAAAETFAADDLHAAPGDRALHGIWPRALLFLDDGTLLVGAEDGTLTGIDEAGHRRFALGLRGAIRGLARAGSDLAVVTTDRGVAALVTSAGRARWERQITAERLGPPLVVRAPDGAVRALLTNSHRGVFALSLDGADLFSHAAPFVHQGCPRLGAGSGWAAPASPASCTEPPGEPPPLALTRDEVTVGPALRFRLDGPHPPVPSLAPVFPLSFTRATSGDVVSILPDGPDAVLALECATHRDYGCYSRELVASLRQHCKLVRVGASAVEDVVSLPEQGARKEVFLEGKPAEVGALVYDAMIRGPGGAPWILGRRIHGATFGGEDGCAGPPGAVGLIFEVRGKRVAERRDLFAAFAAAPTWFPLVAAQDGGAGVLCWGESCAAQDRRSVRPLAWPGAGIFRAATLIAGHAWLTAGVELHRATGATLTPVAAPDKAAFAAVAGASESDVWADAIQRYGLLHFDGTRWTEVPSPPAIGALAARAASDVWSGRMHWDGQRWSLVHGAPDATVVLARAPGDVWMGDPGGLWHGTAPGPQPVDLSPPPPDEGSAPLAPLVLGPPESGYVARRASLAEAKVGETPPLPPSFRLIDGPGPDTRDREAADLRGKGLMLWEEVAPHARVRDGQTWRPLLGLPSAAWMAVAEATDGGAWFAGGLGPGPSGEGILFHARGRLGAEGSQRVRAPASLLAVAAVGAREGWAVGAAGTVVHVRDGAVTRHALASGEWLRAALATDDGVWIGGDGGTLLHHDGTSFHPVPHPLGDHAAITRLSAGRGAVWAWSPSGVVRLARAP